MEEALKQATEQTHKQMIDEQTKTGQTPSLVQSKVMTQLQQKQKEEEESKKKKIAEEEK